MQMRLPLDRRILKLTVTLMLDTSGGPLITKHIFPHKRKATPGETRQTAE